MFREQLIPFDWFDKEFDRYLKQAPSFNPAIDVINHKDSYEFTVELPGFQSEDVDISIDDGVLSIAGEKKIGNKVEDQDSKYVYQERRVGSFKRSFNLPDNANAESVKAEYKNGVLVITVDKKEETKPKKITVKAS
jgi:HSP20 family protein